MKQKSSIIIRVIILSLMTAFSSCEDKNNDLTEYTADLFGENILVTTNIDMNTETRAAFQSTGDNVKLKWQNGDSIALYTSNGEAYAYFASIQNDGKTVVFTAYPNTKKLTGSEGEQVYAILSNNRVNITVRDNHLVADTISYNVCDNSTQRARDLIMYSVGTIHNGKLELNFKHIFAYLKIMVSKDKLKNDCLAILSYTTTIFPSSLDYDIKSQQFSDYTLDNAWQYLFVQKDKMEREGDHYVTYVPVFPTEGDVTYFLFDSKVNETSDRVQMDSVFLLADDPEDGLKAGQTLMIHSEKSIIKSKDKSMDKYYGVLEKATVGPGIKLVFVGQGFTDQDIKSGKYNKAMIREMERFFSVEPYKSFRNRFTSYCVYRVSDSNDLTYIANMPYDSISSESDKACRYTPVFNENDTIARTIVVYNAHFVYRSVTTLSGNGSFVAHIMANDPYVVCHEAGGHGIGFLADEYVEFEGGPTDDDKKIMDNAHKEGAYLNVDYNKEHPIWEKFILNEDYKSEGIGAYEGAHCYSEGYYRPTRNSIMRDHNESHVFNAPSREAIYKAIMKFSGDTYREEDFYKYDRINIFNQAANEARQRGASTTTRHGKIHVKGLPPMIMNK